MFRSSFSTRLARRNSMGSRQATRLRKPALEILETRDLLSFVAPLAFDAGRDNRDVAVGEFSGDGIADLAVANNGNSNVGVLLGNGDGSFQAAQNFPGGGGSLAAGDLNTDGLLDLAVINFSGTVGVLLGNGDGSFRWAGTVDGGRLIWSVAVGEFNGDGLPDLAVPSGANDTVGVLLGNGDGTFQARRDYFGGGGVDVALGDFNGDGLQDLAVTDGSRVRILLGNGDGTFQAPQTFISNNSATVAVGEFNGDGVPDLAVAGWISNTVSVFLGNGDGTFQTDRPVSVMPSYSVSVGEFNGDGHQDLVVRGDANVQTLLGGGDGTFQAPRRFATAGGFHTIAVGEFNGDGLQDVAVANNLSSNVSILRGYGDGTLEATPSFAADRAPQAVALGEFNGDSIPDLAVANWASNNVSVLLGNGDGSFQNARNFPAGLYPHSVTVGDVNGDGLLDLAITGSRIDLTRCTDETVRVLLGNGDGTFQAARSFTAGTCPQSVAVGDVNGDGLLDLAAAGFGYDGQSYYDETVRVLLGNGDGTFQAARSFAAGYAPHSVALGEFNGDNWPDLVTGQIILLGNGDGTFQAARNHGGRGGFVAVGEFNGDGWLDVVTGQVIVLGNGDGTFQAARDHGGRGGFVAVGDVNNDDLLDLVVTAGTVRVLLGNGDGAFRTTHISYVAGGNPSSVAIEDFNGDGFPDLATANSASNDVSILLNDGIWNGGAPGGGSAPGGGRGAPDPFFVAGLSRAGDAFAVLPALSPVWASPLVSTPYTPGSERLPNRVVDQAFTHPFGGRRPGGDNFAIPDEAARFLSEPTLRDMLPGLCTPVGG